MDVLLAQPRGFCAGVDRAIEIVNRALDKHGAPVYVLHEIVHNRHVLQELSARGAVFVKELSEVPLGSVTIFSAHGVAEEIVGQAEQRELHVIDATCPLVTRVHNQARAYRKGKRDVVLIGHRGHPEVEGTKGRIDGHVHVLSTVEEVETLEVPDPDRLSYVTQTTLSVDDTRDVIRALERRFPTIQGPNLKDICYATQNRQNAVKDLVGEVQLLIVVGSRNSSNSNRLRELGERSGAPSHLVDDPDDIDPAWFEDVERIGLTAGASAPEALVEMVLNRLRELGVESVRSQPGEPERVIFQLPDELV